jgi:hypothetical protein
VARASLIVFKADAKRVTEPERTAAASLGMAGATAPRRLKKRACSRSFSAARIAFFPPSIAFGSCSKGFFILLNAAI